MVYLMRIAEIARQRDKIIECFSHPKVTLGETSGDDLYHLVVSGLADLWTDTENRGFMLGYYSDDVYTVQNCAGDFKWNATEWREALNIVEQTVKSAGATKIRIQGRVGWQRLFPEYSLIQIKLEKPL